MISMIKYSPFSNAGLNRISIFSVLRQKFDVDLGLNYYIGPNTCFTYEVKTCVEVRSRIHYSSYTYVDLISVIWQKKVRSAIMTSSTYVYLVGC